MFESFFISHSWNYPYEYNKLVEWFDYELIFWIDNSIPEGNKIHTTDETYLKYVIRERIRKSNFLIIFAAMYANHSEWINFEIDQAILENKKIIAVVPWGQERIPSKIKESATALVGWNKDSIIKAIREN